MKRACCVGLGRMGQIHARALSDLGYQVTTVDTAGHGDYCAVPHRRFDVAVIATPIAHLAESASEWVGFGGRLLVEKPFAANLTEAESLADALAGQRVAVGYVERFNPVAQSLRRTLNVLGGHVERARFVRWNDRSSPDVDLDLRSHDIDLAYWLGVEDVAEYDSRGFGEWFADPWHRQRHIHVTFDGGLNLTADLMAHDSSPVHAQWQAFTGDSSRPVVPFESYATPADALRVHRVLAGVANSATVG